MMSIAQTSEAAATKAAFGRLVEEYKGLKRVAEGLKFENTHLRAENRTLCEEKANFHDSAQYFAKRWDECALECRQLHKELDRRPPLVGFIGRVRYLFGWR